jgi:hypothetical protein
VNIEPSTQVVRLSHYAVTEYLAENSHRLFADADARISGLFLTYLLLDPFSHGPHTEEVELTNLIESYPFVSYAAKHWGNHVRHCEENPLVWKLAVRFLGNRHAIACASQIKQCNKNHQKVYWTPKECYSANALHITCSLGLEKLVLAILSQKPS